MTDMSDIEICHIVSLYKNQREKDKNRYLKIKDSEDFKKKNRERAKAHYNKTREIRAQRYKDNKDVRLAKNCYYYYKRCGRVEDFKNKYPERYDLIQSSFSDKNPSLSTTTSSAVYDSPSPSLSEES